MIEVKHHGRNIRSIRLLQGIKQELFARKMGVSQQYVSKLERQKKISLEKLNAAAKVLCVSVEAIENFNENAMLIAPMDQEKEPHLDSMKEVIEYFREEIAKRDKIIEELRAELEGCKSGKLIPPQRRQ